MLGAAIRFADQSDLATWIWGGATMLTLSALLLEIVAELKRGSIGLDIIAALAMTGALAIGETLAGIVVALDVFWRTIARRLCGRPRAS